MSRLAAFFALLFMALPLAAQGTPAKPPPAPVRTVTTTYFGVDVADPYRYMEDSGDPAARAWIGQQARHARSVLGNIPGRASLLGELKTIDESEPARIGSVVVLPGERYFYLKKGRGRDSYALYQRIGLSGKELLLVDPGAGHPAGAASSRIAFFVPSFDGTHIAYAISDPVTGKTTLHFLNTATGTPMPEAVGDIGLPVAAWLPDGHALFYDRIVKVESRNAPGAAQERSRIYLHRLGTDPSTDIAEFDPRVTANSSSSALGVPFVATAPGSNYVVAVLRRNADGSLILYAAPLAQVGKAAIHWTRIGNDNVTILDYRLRGNQLFVLTNGSEGPVIARVPLRSPGLDNWGLMLQLAPNQTVTGMQALSDAVYLTVRGPMRTSVIRVPYRSAEGIVRAALPFHGSVSLYDADPRADGPLVQLSSPTRAPAIYRYDSRKGTVVRADLWPSSPYDDPTGIASTSAIALGSDGTLVPLTIVYKKGTHRDGTHPTLLVASGARSISSAAVFRPRWSLWLDRGGVLAFPRVGAPTRFEDLLTCARYLIDQGYTTPARLAAIGGGAGAILIGRAITTNPELFRAVVIESGLLDPLRMGNTSNGGAGETEFGNMKTIEGFRHLESLSSYEHVKPGVRYPAVLLEAGLPGAQVPIWQSAKMAARLDADSSSGLPVLLSIHTNRGDAGRGDAISAGLSRKQLLFADEIGFLLWQLGEPGFGPPQPETSATATN
ncbi:MAG TPA: prolyl oligopeptidase family serine peptidase [Patescibacteria group bacterium]|nr:prolyl oligopeptidase family serine peptidase [Patescibacteria group bacterium]